MQAIQDVAWTLQHHDLWRTLGWADIKFRYRRTLLGPLWLTLSTAVTILAIGLLYAGLWHQSIATYIPPLAIGIITWNFLNAAVNDACTAFISAAGFIKAYAIPLSTYTFRLLWRNIIAFFHNFLIIIGIWLIFRWPISPVIGLSLIGCALLILFILGVSLSLAILCARFRDVAQIVASILQLLFFVTPIIWTIEPIGAYRWVVDLNPLYSLIEVVRSPLLNKAPEAYQWLIAVACALVAPMAGLAIYNRYAHRVPYWL